VRLTGTGTRRDVEPRAVGPSRTGRPVPRTLRRFLRRRFVTDGKTNHVPLGGPQIEDDGPRIERAPVTASDPPPDRHPDATPGATEHAFDSSGCGPAPIFPPEPFDGNAYEVVPRFASIPGDVAVGRTDFRRRRARGLVETRDSRLRDPRMTERISASRACESRRTKRQQQDAGNPKDPRNAAGLCRSDRVCALFFAMPIKPAPTVSGSVRRSFAMLFQRPGATGSSSLPFLHQDRRQTRRLGRPRSGLDGEFFGLVEFPARRDGDVVMFQTLSLKLDTKVLTVPGWGSSEEAEVRYRSDFRLAPRISSSLSDPMTSVHVSIRCP
jgi:hypothetical protein